MPPTTVSTVSATTEPQKIWDNTNDDLKEIKFGIKTLAGKLNMYCHQKSLAFSEISYFLR